ARTRDGRTKGDEMGLLVDGKWLDQWYDTASTGGRFVRSEAQFRNWITADGKPGSSGEGGFPAEAGRYHLYVSLACPWAHRTLIFRALKRLEAIVGLSIVNPYMGEHGWTFDEAPGAVPDAAGKARYMYEIYLLAAPDYTGRVTVPVLWDLQRRTSVSTESGEIIRLLNHAFDAQGASPGDYAPDGLLPQIDE